MAEKNKQRDKSIEALRSAPHSIEAEQSVLGGLMLDNDAWDKVSGLIIAQDFYHRAHRLIFTAMQSLADSSQPMDLVTVSEELEANTELDAVGGFAYLGEISKNTPSAANIVAYANIVRERAVLREMIAAANDIAESGYDTQGRTSQQLLDEAESKVFRIAEKRTSATEGPKGVSDILAKTIEKIETLSNIKNHNGVTGTSTGFHDLDQMTAGLQPSDLIIVAARPSMGKTTFAMNLAENVAMNEEKPVLVFSLEMPSEQIMMRMLASLSRVDQNRVRTGRLEDDDWARIASVMNILNDKNNLYIDDSSGLTPTEVRSRARRVARD
ncbi:MAG TPA: replicative DNA helicase, partial [Idiomarina baltica]|nr:replicative DNA helicase [Idiomarina baltica]